MSSMESFWQPHFAKLVGGAAENTLFFGAVMAGNFLVATVGNVLATPLSKLVRNSDSELPFGAVRPLLAPSWLTAEPRTTAKTV